MATPAAASRLTTARAARGKQRRTVRSDAGPVHYRITGAKKVLLITLALVLDTLPLLGVIIAGALFATAASSLSSASTLGCAVDSIFQNPMLLLGGPASILTACSGGAVAAGAAGVGVLMLTPLIYTVLSIFSFLTAIALFPLLFLACGYNPLGLKMKKISVNIASFVIEGVPIINALIPMITLHVLFHIHFSRKEDRVKGHSNNTFAA